MLTQHRELTDNFSPDLDNDPIEKLIGKMGDAGVPNLFLEKPDQPAAIFMTTDPAVIEVLRGVFEEAGDLSAFFTPSDS